MAEATLNLHVDDYTNRVLGVVKEMFGLKDKSQALKKFVDMYGNNFVQKEVNDETVQSLISQCDAHVKKYKMKKMSLKELDELTNP
jgi:hypothetical protein